MSFIPSIQPVRSLCLETLILPSRNKTRRGLHPFKSKLDEITGAHKGYEPRSMTYNGDTGVQEAVTSSRITFARTKGKNRFHAVGIGEFAGTFGEFKEEMKRRNFTGYRMFGKICSLN